MRQRFHIGDPVEVSPACDFHGEWDGQPLWIVAVEWSDRLHTAMYSTADSWPPNSGWTTDWQEIDLAPRGEVGASKPDADDLQDRAYLNGLKAGWNLGIANANGEYNSIVSARSRR